MKKGLRVNIMSIIKPAARLQRVTGNSFLEMTHLKAAAYLNGQLKHDLSHGVPDIPPPRDLLDKLQVYCRNEGNHNRLTFTRPSKTLASSIDQYVHMLCPGAIQEYGTVLSAGSKEIIFHISLALLDHGDVVLIPEIAYPYYRSAAEMAGARVLTYPLEPESYLPMLDAIGPGVLQRAKLLWLTNPHNPTGTVISEPQLWELTRFCQAHDIVMCHDMVYRSIVFDNHTAPSIFGCKGAYTNLIEIHSFSKVLSIAGWRVALTLGDPKLIESIQRSLFLSSNGLFLVLQHALRYALLHFDELAAQITARYARRVNDFAEALERNGLTYHRPQGAYYFWMPVPSGFTDLAFVKALLESTGILVFPGSAFGPAGRDFFRVSLVRPSSVLVKAAKAMATCHLSRANHYLARRKTISEEPMLDEILQCPRASL